MRVLDISTPRNNFRWLNSLLSNLYFNNTKNTSLYQKSKKNVTFFENWCITICKQVANNKNKHYSNKIFISNKIGLYLQYNNKQKNNYERKD